MRNKKYLFLVVVFLLLMVLPVIKVDSAVTVWIDITNPLDEESFGYEVIDEIFTANIIVSGLGSNTAYDYDYRWYIDSVEIDDGTGFQITSSSGQLSFTAGEFDTTVNISACDSGEHLVGLEFIITLGGDFLQEIHNHVFFREVDPNATNETTNTSTNNETWFNDFWVTWYGKTVIIGGGSLLLIIGFSQLRKEKVVEEDEK